AHTLVLEPCALNHRRLITRHGPGNGKTKLASVITKPSKNGQHLSTAVTGPLLGRIRKEYPGGVMLALDQLDNAFDMNAQGPGALLDKLIGGADRGSKKAVLGQTQRGRAPELVDRSFPISVVKIGDLPSAALNSRAITIQMYPATAEEDKQLQQYTAAMLHRDINRLVLPQRLPPAMVKRQVVPEGKQPQALIAALLPSMMKR